VPTNICDSCQRLEEERWRWNPWPWLTFVKQKQTSARIQCDGKQQADTCQRTLCTPCRFPPFFFLLHFSLEPCDRVVRCCSFTTVPICDDYEWMSSPRRGNLSMYFYVSFLCSVANRGWAAVASTLLLLRKSNGCVFCSVTGDPYVLHGCTAEEPIQ
jgi:hypothetical protein